MGLRGIRINPKENESTHHPDFLLGSVSPPTPSFINTLGNQPLRFGWCGIRIPGQIKRLVSRTRGPMRGRGWRWWCHRKNAWRESSSKVLLSPGPGRLVSIAASCGCLPKKMRPFMRAGLKKFPPEKWPVKVCQGIHDYPSGMRWYPYRTRT